MGQEEKIKGLEEEEKAALGKKDQIALDFINCATEAIASQLFKITKAVCAPQKDVTRKLGEQGMRKLHADIVELKDRLPQLGKKNLYSPYVFSHLTWDKGPHRTYDPRTEGQEGVNKLPWPLTQNAERQMEQRAKRRMEQWDKHNNIRHDYAWALADILEPFCLLLHSYGFMTDNKEYPEINHYHVYREFEWSEDMIEKHYEYSKSKEAGEIRREIEKMEANAPYFESDKLWDMFDD